MSEVRRDIFTGYYVIISEARASRPMGILYQGPSFKPDIACPFCPGNEQITPEELYKDGDSWSIRSFPNKYPALSEEGVFEEDSFFGGYNGAGEHEVLVDTRSHMENLWDFSEEHLQRLIISLMGRYRHYYAIDETKYVQIFKNSGIKAGATQPHSHWQIVAGRFIPYIQEVIGGNLFTHKQKTGKCLYCEFIEKELKANERILYEDNLFAALTPYASRFTYETWILPKRHISSVSELNQVEINSLACLLKAVMEKLNKAFGSLNYNILLMDSPKSSQKQLFHWHMQILPRMGTLAGYEFSTGGFINHITPEKAALQLRL